MGSSTSRLDAGGKSTAGRTISSTDGSMPPSVKTLNDEDRAIMEATELSPVSSPREPRAGSISDDRLAEVRSIPGVRKVLSKKQSRSSHIGKSRIRRGAGLSEEFYSSSESAESSSEFDPDKMAAEVQEAIDATIGVRGMSPEGSITLDDEGAVDLILTASDRPVRKMPHMGELRQRSTVKTISYLEETAHTAVIKRRNVLGLATSITEEEPKTKDDLMRKYMAEIHITIIGPVFGKDGGAAVPMLQSLSPRSLKLAMATMAEAPDGDEDSMFSYEPLRISETIRGMSPLEMKAVRGAIWKNIYVWTQLMSHDSSAPWMRKSTKVRSGIEHLDIVVSDKVYTHEYDSHDKDLVFIDETAVFPILPFKPVGKVTDKSKASSSSKLKAMTAGTEGLKKIHPQIAYGCFQNLTSDTPGCMMFRLKQVVHTDSFVCGPGSMSSMSFSSKDLASATVDAPTSVSAEQLRLDGGTGSVGPLKISGGDGSTSPTASVCTEVNDLACAMLYVNDLFANISKVTRTEVSTEDVAQRERQMSESLVTMDSSGMSKSTLLSRTKKSYNVLYESDSFLYQLPLYKSIDNEVVRKTATEIDRLGISSPMELIEKSKIDEKKYSNLSYRTLKKPKASGALICQCQFVWKAD